jgi:hypothetical protein
MLGTTAPVPRHDLAWCGCGGSAVIPGWFECPTTGLAGFRLFRRLTSSRKSWSRLPKIALGFVGGLLIGTVLTVSIMVGATLHPIVPAPMVLHVVSK